MKIICAPDKFKASLSAPQAAEAMARGIRGVRPDAEVDLCPVADGGEGTVEALVSAQNGRFYTTTVAGPRQQPVSARWGVYDRAQGRNVAVIEMVQASGLVLLPKNQRDPTRTSTFGAGQLIRAALDEGAESIIIGIGGSATTDGGCGMAQALGVRFYERTGQEISAPITGGMLGDIGRIDMSRCDPRLSQTTLQAACDVTNPLTGLNGAARVYAPQKGATPAQVDLLERGLVHLAAIIRAQLQKEIETLPGAGAAGGLGAGLVAFLGATLVPGIELILQASGFPQRVIGCDLCLTGEGRIDGQTARGKACLGVAQAAARTGVPTIALAGSAGAGAEQALRHGLKAYHVIGAGLALEESIRHAEELLEKTTARVVREWLTQRDQR